MDVVVAAVVVVIGLVVTADVLGLSDSLFEAQAGYLHLNRALLMYSSSFCSSCALVQTVLALCIRVLKTLYLADRLWLLFQWRNWCV